MFMILVEANHVKHYVHDRLLLDINKLKIYKKDRIGLVGRNGSGKTSLLQMMANKIAPDEGEIIQHTNVELLPQLKQMNKNKSGGEITKNCIDKTIAKNAEVLFADEPTANLDTHNIKALEKHFARYKGAILIVSHNRYFLDKNCTKIWEIEDSKVQEFHGNYTSYVEQKEILHQKQQEEYEKYIKKKKQLEQAITLKEQKAQKMIKPPSKRMGTSESRVWKMQHATKQKNMHQNIKALETRVQKLEHVEKPKEFPTIKMNFSYLKQLQGRYVIRVNNLSVNFDNRLLWKEASFAIKGGEKVAIIGDNGVGKTT